MDGYQAKLLATSLAGHDKGKCYVVVRADDDCVYLADGVTRPLERPKRKNRKHVQLISHIPEQPGTMMEQIRDDTDVRRILKVYANRNNE